MTRPDHWNAADKDTEPCPTCQGARRLPCPLCGGAGCGDCRRGGIPCEDCEGVGVVGEAVAKLIREGEER